MTLSSTSTIRRVAGGALLGAVGLFCAAAQLDEAPSVEGLEDWSEGPVHWYLLPTEKRALKEIETNAEAVNFVERFWHLRDPDPTTGTNEFRNQFNERVEAADILYGEGNLRGSLSARGRALVVLGPPAHMRVATQPALAWDQQSKGKKRTTTKEVVIEVWKYPPEDLPRRLLGVLPGEAREAGIELRFRIGSQTSQIVDGEASLLTAARVVLIRD